MASCLWRRTPARLIVLWAFDRTYDGELVPA